VNESNEPAVDPDPPLLEIQVRHEADDMIAASQLMTRIDPAMRRTIRRVRIYAPISSLVIAAGAFWLGDRIVATIMVFLACYFLFVARRMVGRGAIDKLKKDIEQGMHRSLGQPMTFVITSDALRVNDASTQGRIAWDRLIRVIETQDCLFLYTLDKTALYVPRRCVESGDYDAFRDAVAERVPIQFLNAGTTFEQVRAKEHSARDRDRRFRVIKASAAGVFATLVSAPLIFAFTERTAPRLADSVGLYATTFGLLPAALGIAVAVWRATATARIDYETRCRKCQYILKSLVEPRCPECGERI